MKKYIEGDFEITELDNGAIIKQAISAPYEEIPQVVKPNVDERLTNIENTLDIILLKQEGLL